MHWDWNTRKLSSPEKRKSWQIKAASGFIVKIWESPRQLRAQIFFFSVLWDNQTIRQKQLRSNLKRIAVGRFVKRRQVLMEGAADHDMLCGTFQWTSLTRYNHEITVKAHRCSTLRHIPLFTFAVRSNIHKQKYLRKLWAITIKIMPEIRL